MLYSRFEVLNDRFDSVETGSLRVCYLSRLGDKLVEVCHPDVVVDETLVFHWGVFKSLL